MKMGHSQEGLGERLQGHHGPLVLFGKGLTHYQTTHLRLQN